MGKRVHSTQYELIQHQPAVADSEREAGPLPVDWMHFYNQINIWHKNALFSHKKLLGRDRAPSPDSTPLGHQLCLVAFGVSRPLPRPMPKFRIRLCQTVV